MRIQSIELKITLDDGEVVEGSMSAEYGEQRWGNDISHLGACVAPMEAMNEALSDGDFWATEKQENSDVE